MGKNLNLQRTNRDICILNDDISSFSLIQISLLEIGIPIFKIQISLLELEISLCHIEIKISAFEIELNVGNR